MPKTLRVLCRTITGQPRRAGDFKIEEERIPGVGCNDWFGLGSAFFLNRFHEDKIIKIIKA